MTVSDSKKVTQQPITEGVVYDDIKAFQNKKNCMVYLVIIAACACKPSVTMHGKLVLGEYEYHAIIGNLKATGKVIDDPNHTVIVKYGMYVYTPLHTVKLQTLLHKLGIQHKVLTS